MADEAAAPAAAARQAERALAAMARPAGEFDASRYFRGTPDLGFYNVRTATIRAMARSIVHEHRERWTVDEAMAFAGALVPNRYIDVKGLAIEVVARYRRQFTPRLLPAWKRWLAAGHASNWATTDAICGLLIGPLLLAHPRLAPQMRAWARHRALWVRRAAAVALVPSARRGRLLDLAYDVAASLHADREDLIHKAVGWLLREAGKTDPVRLERYLLDHGPAIPRTTLRYAIERFPRPKRQALLAATRTRQA